MSLQRKIRFLANLLQKKSRRKTAPLKQKIPTARSSPKSINRIINTLRNLVQIYLSRGTTSVSTKRRPRDLPPNTLPSLSLLISTTTRSINTLTSAPSNEHPKTLNLKISSPSSKHATTSCPLPNPSVSSFLSPSIPSNLPTLPTLLPKLSSTHGLKVPLREPRKFGCTPSKMEVLE